MSKKSERITLSRLYKTDSFRNIIWNALSIEFEEIFNRLIDEASNLRSLLVKPAKSNKFWIKELVIEYGYEFENLEHLKKCLDALKYWDNLDVIDCACEKTENIENLSIN